MERSFNVDKAIECMRSDGRNASVEPGKLW